MDVGTILSYWQAHMDLLKDPPVLNLNDRTWIVHSRTEAQPPVRIAEGAIIKNSMITDGCIIQSGAVIEDSILLARRIRVCRRSNSPVYPSYRWCNRSECGHGTSYH